MAGCRRTVKSVHERGGRNDDSDNCRRSRGRNGEPAPDEAPSRAPATCPAATCAAATCAAATCPVAGCLAAGCLAAGLELLPGVPAGGEVFRVCVEGGPQAALDWARSGVVEEISHALASMAAVSAARPRLSCDFTVPTEVPMVWAISRSGRSSQNRSTIASRRLAGSFARAAITSA